MSDELTFRVVFIVLWIAFGAVGVYYGRGQVSLKGHSIRERWAAATKQEGVASVVLWHVHRLVLFLGIVFYLLGSPWTLWSNLPLPLWMRWIGVGVGMVSLPLFVWIWRTLGEEYSPYLELREGHRLATSGPYRRVRHPMYVAYEAFFAAGVMVSASLLLLLALIIGVVHLYGRVGKEERMMLERFGDEYRAYMQRTGRFLPRFRREPEED